MPGEKQQNPESQGELGSQGLRKIESYAALLKTWVVNGKFKKYVINMYVVRVGNNTYYIIDGRANGVFDGGENVALGIGLTPIDAIQNAIDKSSVRDEIKVIRDWYIEEERKRKYEEIKLFFKNELKNVNANQPINARIAHVLSKIILVNFNEKVGLKLERTGKVIDRLLGRVSSGMPLLPSDIREIKVNLLKDILDETRGLRSSKSITMFFDKNLDVIADIIADYIAEYVDGHV